MFRANQSGYNTLQNKVLDNAKIQSNLQPFGSDVDIGAQQNKFKRIFASEMETDSIYTATISTGNYYSVLANIDTATIGNLRNNNIKTTNATVANIQCTNADIQHILANNITTSNLLTSNITTASLLSGTATIASLRQNNIANPVYYNSAGNLSVKVDDLTVKLNGSGELSVKASDFIIGDDPLNVITIGEYASLFGLSVEDVASLFGIDNDLISNYTVVSLSYNTDHFQESGLVNSKLELKLPSDKRVLFVDTDALGGNKEIVGMPSFAADFGTNTITAGNLYSNNLTVDDANIVNLTLANLRITNDDVVIPYCEGDDIYYTNATLSNLYVSAETTLDYMEANNIWTTNLTSGNVLADNSNIVNMTLANLRITNDDVVIPYCEGDNLFYTNATINNIKLTGLLDADFMTISSMTVGNDLIVNGEAEFENVWTTSLTTANMRQTGQATMDNMNILSIDEVSQFNLQGQGTASNLLIQYGTIGTRLAGASNAIIDMSNADFTNITVSNLRSTATTVGKLLCSDKITTDFLLVNGDVTTGSIKNTGTITTNKVVLGDLSPTVDAEATSKKYVDEMSYVIAGAGITKSTSTVGTTLAVNANPAGYLISSASGIDWNSATKTSFTGYGTRIAALEAFRTTRDLVPVPNFTGIGLDPFDFYVYSAISVKLAGVVATATGLGVTVDGLSGLVDNTDGDVYAQGSLGSRELNINPNKTINITNANILTCSIGNLITNSLSVSSITTGTLVSTLVSSGVVAATSVQSANQVSINSTITSLLASYGNLLSFNSIVGSIGTLLVSTGNLHSMNTTMANVLNQLSTNVTATNLITSTGNAFALNSTNGNIANLTVGSAQIGTARITTSSIGYFVCTNATTTNLITSSGNIFSLNVTNGNLVNVTASSTQIGTARITTGIGSLAVSTGNLYAVSITSANVLHQVSINASITNLIGSACTISNLIASTGITTSTLVAQTIGSTVVSSGSLMGRYASIGTLSITSSTIGIFGATTVYYDTISGSMRFRFNNTQGMILTPTSAFINGELTLSSIRINSAIQIQESGTTFSLSNAWDGGDMAFSTYNNFTFSGFSELMCLTSAGNLGIGISSPETKLSVNSSNSGPALRLRSQYGGSSSFTGLQFSLADTTVSTDAYCKGAILYNNVGTYGRGNMFFCLNNINNSSNVSLSDSKMTILDSGNVGIGTTSPLQTLDVIGGILVRGNSSISNQGAYLHWNRSNGDGETLILNQKGGGNSNAGIRFGSATTTGSITEWMRIIDNGNIGIGTTSPNALLQLGNTIANRKIVLWESNNNDHQYYGLGINAGVLRYQVDTTSSAHVFYAGASSSSSNELMRISGNGNVGIGVSPSSTFHIVGGQNGTERFRIGSHLLMYEHASLSGPNVGASIVFNSGYIGAIRSAGAGIALCDNGGSVGIGTTAPSFLLDVNGKSRFRNSASFNYTSSTVGSAGNQTWTVANVESRLIVRSGLTGTTTDTMPARTDFTNAGYTTGDPIEFIVHNLSAQTYSLTSSGSQYNSMVVLTNVPKKFLIRITSTAVDLYAI